MKDGFIQIKLIIAILGLSLLFSTMFISQIAIENTVISDSVKVTLNNQNSSQAALTLYLRQDDKIQIETRQNTTDTLTAVSVDFLGRPSASSDVSVNPALYWVCNGGQNYTVTVKSSGSLGSQAVEVIEYHVVIRSSYCYAWLFPIGLVLGSALIFTSLEIEVILRSIGLQRSWFIGKLKVLFCNKQLISKLSKRIKAIDRYAGLLLFFFMVFSLCLNTPLLHNDEIGGGQINDWGYFAWGYVDTNNQVVDLIRFSDFTYDSWHSLQTMNKPPLAHYLMSSFVLSFPDLSPVTASRLFVQVTAALTPVVLYFLLKEMFDRKAGIIAATLLFFDPIFLNYTRAAYLEGPILLFLSLFLLMLYRASVTAKTSYVYLTGICLGLVISTKSLLFVYPLVPMVFIWLLHMSPKGTINLKRAIFIALKVTAVAVVLFFVLWPAMWVNPFLKTVFQGAFFGVFGSYGPQFSISYPELFFGTVQSPVPFVHAVALLVYQTTYIELLGFIAGFALLIYKIRSRLNRGILAFLTLSAAGLAVLYVYQHHLLYFILPYAVVSGIGYASIINYVRNKVRLNLKSYRVILTLSLLAIVGGQLLLVFQASPYYGLYYNNAFLGANQPQDLFEIPEPVYGLDQAVKYITDHPPQEKTILTTNAPHVLQIYLPNYLIKTAYHYLFDNNDERTLFILRNLGVEYVVISASALQSVPDLHLKTTMDKNANLVLTCRGGGTPLAYLYQLPPISTNNVTWSSSDQNAVDWVNISNTHSSSFNKSQGQLQVTLNFNSSYPPSLWFKLTQFQGPYLNLTNAFLYLVYTAPNSSATTSLTLIDQNGASVETALNTYQMNFETTIFCTKIVDLFKNKPSIDFSNITRLELTFYNTKKASESIIIKEFALLK